MYAQLTFFDGPRSYEMVRAGHRAGQERIAPAMRADPRMRDELVALYVPNQPDGAEVYRVSAFAHSSAELTTAE
jgi:hypothetical protein